MRVHLWRRQTSAAALLVALSLASPVATRADDVRHGAGIADLPAIRIDNFGRVDPVLYRGAQPEGRLSGLKQRVKASSISPATIQASEGR